MNELSDPQPNRTAPSGAPRLAPHAPFAPGDPVPNLEMWILDRKLGGGGFGQVWLARHERKGEAAVKFCTDPEAQHKLITHEKAVVKRVMQYGGNHPNVVPLLECNLSGSIPWLMYEYVPGGTLAESIATWSMLPPDQRLVKTVRIMSALAGALALFHSFKPPLVHRDMKPHNVLLAGGTVPRIIDFGIGGVAVRPQNATADAGTHTAHSAQVPISLSGAGTRKYAPIEQRLSEGPKPWHDVYALGIMTYEMLLGDLKAEPGPDADKILRNLKVPNEIISLIVASVGTDPKGRPENATAWKTVLSRFTPTPPPLPGPPPPLSPPPPEPDPRARIEADFERGVDYHRGRGVRRDYAKARAAYELAAAKGHAGAQHGLGVLYECGHGVKEDLPAALEWYRKAEAQGHSGAITAVKRLLLDLPQPDPAPTPSGDATTGTGVWHYCVKGGAANGPMSFAELQAAARAGLFTRDDVVWKEGTSNWVSAGAIRGLFGS